MKKLAVLLAADVLGALSSGSLEDNVYICDTSGYLGSWNEGMNNLHSIVQDGQFISYACHTISPETSLEIKGFSGPMVSGGVLVPKPEGPPGDREWRGQVQSRGQYASFQGEVEFDLDGTSMSCTVTVKVV